MDISVRQMEVLRAVLTQGGMTAAASNLGLTQPAVSRIIAQIERHMGLQLFVKSGRNISPTPEAKELGLRIEEVFEKVDVVRRHGRLLKNGGGRRIRIAISPPLAGTFFARAVAKMRKRFPQCVFVIKMREMGSVETPSIDQDFDIAVSYNSSRSPDAIAQTLCEAPVVCYLPTGHALAAKRELTAKDLEHADLMSFNLSSRLGMPLEKAFQDVGLKWRPVLQTGNSFVTVPLVRAGAGIAIADPFIWHDGPVDGVEIRPFAPTYMLKPQIQYRRQNGLSAPEEYLIEELLKEGKLWSERFAHYLDDIRGRYAKSA